MSGLTKPSGAEGTPVAAGSDGGILVDLTSEVIERLPTANLSVDVLNQLSTGRVTFDGFTLPGGLDLDVGAGSGVIKEGPPIDAAPAVLIPVTWAAQTITIPANVTRHVMVNKTGTVVLVSSPPDVENFIVIGTVISDAASLVFISKFEVDVIQPVADFSNYIHRTVGALVEDGMRLLPTAPASLSFQAEAGTFYIDKDYKAGDAEDPVTFSYWHQDPGSPLGWKIITTQTDIDPDFYDDGSGTLAAVPVGKYKKDLALAAPDTDSTVNWHVFYGQELFDSQLDAELGNLPTVHDHFPAHALRSTGLVVTESAASIATFVDVRPRLGSFAPPSTSVTDHGGLTGKTDDDHPQYQLRSEEAVGGGYVQEHEVTIAGTDYNSNNGNTRYRSIASAGSHRFTFFVPFDLDTLVSAAFVVFVDGAGAEGIDKDIDLSVSYGKIGESKDAATATDFTSLYVIPAQEVVFEIPLTTLLAGVEAGDMVSVFVDHKGVGGVLGYVGVRLRYQR